MSRNVHQLKRDPDADPSMLDVSQAAKKLDVHPRTLRRWRDQKSGPPYCQVLSTGSVYYRRKDLEAFLLLDRTVERFETT